MKRISEVWNYFKNYSEPNKTARCTICEKELSFRGSVSNLKKHLVNSHSINIQSTQVNQNLEQHIVSLSPPHIKPSSPGNSNNDDPYMPSIPESSIPAEGSIHNTASEQMESIDRQNKPKQNISMKRKRVSGLWKYFKEYSKQNKTAKCKICNVKLSFRGTVSNLRKHLVRAHSIYPQSTQSMQVKKNLKQQISSPPPDIKPSSPGNSNNDDPADGSVHRIAIAQLQSINIKQSKRVSEVWTYFKDYSEQIKTAKCTICDTELSFRGTVSNLKKHLLKKHSINVQPTQFTQVNKNVKQRISSPPSDIKPSSSENIIKDDSPRLKSSVPTGGSTFNTAIEQEQSISVKQMKPKQNKNMKHKRVSGLWKYFKEYSLQNKTARCTICDMKLSFRGTISNLKKHLVKAHSIYPQPNQSMAVKKNLDQRISSPPLDIKPSSPGNSNKDDPADGSVHRIAIAQLQSINIKKSKRVSEVWTYFKEYSEQIKTAKCTICDAELSFRGNAYHLKKHLLKKHSINIQPILFTEVNTNLKQQISSPPPDIKPSSSENIIKDDSPMLESSVPTGGSILNTAIEQEQSICVKQMKPKQNKNIKHKRVSGLWKYFKEDSMQNKTARCTICDSKLSFRGTVSNLRKHLVKAHSVNAEPKQSTEVNQNWEQRISSPHHKTAIEQVESINTKQIKPKQNKNMKHKRVSGLWKYFKEDSMQNKTARCTICDSKLSFRGTVSNLRKHLVKAHSINAQPKQSTEVNQNWEQRISSPPPDIKPSLSGNIDNDGPAEGSVHKTAIEQVQSINAKQIKPKQKINLKPKRVSGLWKYFKEYSMQNKTARCKICDTKLSFRGTVSNLKRHLIRAHSLNVQSTQSTQVNYKVEQRISSPSLPTNIEPNSSGNSGNDDPSLPAESSIHNTGPCNPSSTSETLFQANLTPNTNTEKVIRGQRKEINEALMLLLIKNVLPISIVEDPNFQKFVTALNPSYQLPSREQISNVISVANHLPALTCVDLFPDPPHMIAQFDEQTQEGSLADDDEFAGFKIIENKLETDQNEIFKEEPCESPNSLTKNQQPENVQDDIVPKTESPNNQLIEEVPKPSTIATITIASAPESPASYFSSAESIASSASSSKKTKKRYCRQCDMHFRKTRELHEHLKMHISLPEIRVERLSDDNNKVKEYLSSISPKTSPTHGSLKLKFKLLGSQNFEVVPSEKDVKQIEEDSRIRVLKAADIRCKPELEENTPLDPYTQDPKLSNSFPPPENRYFECPTFDGLDNFADEMLHTGEATEDLLKKLLENNKEAQSFSRETDWSGNANEFISIDSLAPRCNVCHMNFSHPKYLYEHKQITGHDFQHRIVDPIPASQANYGHHPQNCFMQATHPPPQNMPPLYQMAQMRGNFPGYGPRLNVRHMMHNHPQPSPPPGFHPAQCMITRTPPPLYRVNGNPSNFPPTRYLEKRPEMYGPAPPQFMNGNQQVNQEMMRQPIFLKSRLQKAIRGRSQGPTNEIPTSPGILTQQTAIRPRFLGPTPQMPGHMQFQRAHLQTPPKQGEPPMKKVKLEAGQNQFSSPPPNGINNSHGMPIIQSVHCGVNASNFPQLTDKPKETTSSPGNQTSPTAKGVVKNPKDVANILATRGITVTHRGKTSFVSLANKGSNSANASAQEAVQKLQANNSVSIISKKKPLEINVTKAPAPGTDGGGHRITTKFLSCPVITCKEKFLTVEGVNRHAFRWHGIPMPNPDRGQKRIIRCRLCHHICASPEILQDHIRREHEPSVNEIGIPIVDLRNDEVKRKLAGLGIFNYVPLTAAGASTSSLAFPVVSVQGAANPSICNLLGLGASSVLSLGPVKSITVRKPSNENNNKHS